MANEYIDLEQQGIQQAESDLLMHEQPEDKEEKEATKKAEEQAIADARTKLVEYTDLQTFRPFQLFLRDLSTQINAEFTAMESTTDPVTLAKRVGAYCALTRTYKHTAREIAEASLFLRAQARKP